MTEITEMKQFKMYIFGDSSSHLSEKLSFSASNLFSMLAYTILSSPIVQFLLNFKVEDTFVFWYVQFIYK